MKRNGFSLVELSIVLVILGLLVGGILASQSLIRASELRAVASEANRYATALHAFRDKYFSYPGDMTNATSFWGIAGGSTGHDATCYSAVTNDARTCNGNGNGQLINLSASQEIQRFWQHLSNAGLIEGQYTGYTTSVAPGLDVPASKIEARAGWVIMYNGAVASSANAFDGNYGNYFSLFTRPVLQGVLTPAEAWNIDKKLDDGAPATGKVLANWSATYSAASVACTLATSGADSAAAFNLASSTKDCGLYWVRQ